MSTDINNLNNINITSEPPSYGREAVADWAIDQVNYRGYRKRKFGGHIAGVAHDYIATQYIPTGATEESFKRGLTNYINANQKVGFIGAMFLGPIIMAVISELVQLFVAWIWKKHNPTATDTRSQGIDPITMIKMQARNDTP